MGLTNHSVSVLHKLQVHTGTKRMSGPLRELAGGHTYASVIKQITQTCWISSNNFPSNGFDCILKFIAH